MAKRSKKRKSLVGRLRNVIDSALLMSSSGMIIWKLEDYILEGTLVRSGRWAAYDSGIIAKTDGWAYNERVVDYKNLPLRDLRMLIYADWQPVDPISPLEALASIL